MKYHFKLQPSRRHFLTTLGAGALGTTAALPSFGATTPSYMKVVVIGGGMAGATVAKYLRLWSNKTVDVTIIEPSATYVSNIMSNLVVTGQYLPSILNFNWNTLKSSYGVKVVQGTVKGVVASGSGWNVSVNGSGTTYYADRVVVAPGIDFHPVYDDNDRPVDVLHAWKAGPQTTQLNSLLTQLTSTSTVVMTIPSAPYRCPPGPYERACVIADYLQRNKPGAKIIVLDANLSVTAEKENFTKAFTLYPNLQYLSGHRLKFITPAGGVTTAGSVTVDRLASDSSVLDQKTFSGNLLNIIPPQKAGQIAQTLGLCDASGFAPVDGLSFESTISGKKGIHIIGDASKTSLPKAGHVGNQGAKICADAILRAFTGNAPYATPTANSACFSPISNTMASWLTAVYQYENVANTYTGTPWNYIARDLPAGTTGPTEASGPSTGNFSKMYTWYKTLMTETYA
ncbi:MAG: FAD-dependent oxidoreductase [Limnohabitans sp.]